MQSLIDNDLGIEGFRLSRRSKPLYASQYALFVFQSPEKKPY